MQVPILLFYAALASASPTGSILPRLGPPVSSSTQTIAAPAPSINSIGAASSIASFMASPSFAPYVKPTEDVVEWIALGDSYTAGTGSNGNAEVFAGDAVRGQRSAPMQMRVDTAWDFINTGGSGIPSRFSFSAYTGDTTQQLLTDQLVAGAYRPTNYLLPRHPFGAPQLAAMTIGGNDAYLTEIINNCLYRAWLPGNCDDTLNQLQSDLTNGVFKDKISLALFQTVYFGREQAGANPRDSFQVYISEYIPFFDTTTTACNDYSWGWWTSDYKITQALRTRLNSLTTQVNSVIEDAANELERLGVVFVTGIAEQYSSGNNQFCAPGHDTNNQMTDADTWFWSQYLGTGSDSEGGTDGSSYNAAFSNTTLQSVLDFVYGKGTVTPKTYANSSLYNTQGSTPYQSFDDLINAMRNSTVEEYALVSLGVQRSMHPKGTPFVVHTNAFMAAIADNRGAAAVSQSASTLPVSSPTGSPVTSAAQPPVTSPATSFITSAAQPPVSSPTIAAL